MENSHLGNMKTQMWLVDISWSSLSKIFFLRVVFLGFFWVFFLTLPGVHCYIHACYFRSLSGNELTRLVPGIFSGLASLSQLYVYQFYLACEMKTVSKSFVYHYIVLFWGILFSCFILLVNMYTTSIKAVYVASFLMITCLF